MTRIAVGAVAFGACTLSFVPAIREAVRISDLTVRVPRRPMAFAGREGAFLPGGRDDPPRLRSRAALDLDGQRLVDPDETAALRVDLPSRGPGLHLLRWSVRYGDVWDRSVGLAYVEGPFARSGRAPCGIGIGVAARLLDDGDVAGGDDLATGLEAPALRLLNGKLAKIDFPSALGAKIGLRIVSEGLRVDVRFDFGVHGSFETGTTVGFAPQGTGLGAYLADDVDFRPDGQFRALLASRGFNEGAQAGFVLGLLFPPAILVTTVVGGVMGEAKAPDVARDHVREAVREKLLPFLDEALRLPEPFHLDREQRRSRVALTYCGPVRTEPDRALSVGLNVAIETNPSRSVAGLLGPVRFGATAPAAAPPSDSDISVTISPDVLNAALYAIWQTGQLRRWIAKPELTKRFNAAIQHLPVRLRDIDPVLPPMMQPAAGNPTGDLDLRGDFRVQLASTRSRHAARAASVFVGVRLRGREGTSGEPTARLDLGDLVLGCAEPTVGEYEARTPCFADVVQMARSWGGLDAGNLEGVRAQLDDLLSRLKPAGGASPVRLKLERVGLAVDPGAPPNVRLDGKVRVAVR